MQSSRPSRYQAIANDLARHGQTTVVLTYAEVERMIGAQLPPSAPIILTWWTDPTQMHMRM